MRILQLVQKPQRRGAEVFATQLRDALCRQGHTVRVAFLYPYSGSEALALADGDQVLDGVESSVFDRLIGADPALLRQVRRAIAEFKPDVVQLNGGRTVKYGVLARLLSRGSRFALVYRNIGNPRDWLRGTPRPLFYRWLMKRVDGVVAVSQGALTQLREVYSLRTPSAVIRTGIDEEALTPRRSVTEIRAATNTASDAPVVLFVGSLSPEKRVDRLLKVFGRVRQSVPDAVLWIVGDGPLRASLEASAAELGIEKAVRFLGTRPDVSCHMAAADVVALLSDTEGVPAVLLEAGYLGRPVVATQVGGIGECVLDGRTGILVAPADEEEIAASITRLLRDPVERAAMGKHAVTWVRSGFSLTSIAGDYVQFYRTVLAQRSAVTAARPVASQEWVRGEPAVAAIHETEVANGPTL
jgi:glycosyltransferase involved in cell wall biosynthesis